MLGTLQCSVCAAKHRIPDRHTDSEPVQCPTCGAAIRAVAGDDRACSAGDGGRTKLWQGAVLVLAGLGAFLAGAWLFMPAVPSPAVAEAPAPASTEESEPEPVSSAPEAETTPPTSSEEVTANPPKAPAVNPRLTRDNFERLRNGMTEEQVEAILGEPNEVKIKTDRIQSLNRQVKVLHWAQARPPAVIEVEFVNGLSASKTTTLPAAAAPRSPDGPFVGTPEAAEIARSTKLNQTNLDRVQNGMTEAEVRAIFGPPNASRMRTATLQGKTKILMWREIQRERDYSRLLTLTVTLRADRVAGKNLEAITIPKGQ